MTGCQVFFCAMIVIRFELILGVCLTHAHMCSSMEMFVITNGICVIYDVMT